MSEMDNATALKLLDEDYDINEYEVVEQCVDDGHIKHDITAYYSVFLRKADNTFWKIHFDISYNYGLFEDGVYVYQVQKKEVVTYEWVGV